MTTLGLREFDRLDDAFSFTAWKCRLQMLLEEVELWVHIENEIAAPINLALLAMYNKVAKAKRIILDFVKEHLITDIVEKIGKKMYDALVALYQSARVSRKMFSKNKFLAIRMSGTDTMVSYLGTVTELRDQLSTTGTKWWMWSWCPLH